MKKLFDEVCIKSSRMVTKTYSTSFYAGVNKLHQSIRNDVHAIYGFVRFADEIVDTFHEFEKATLLAEFRADTEKAIARKIALNPILNSFQNTVHKYNIPYDLIDRFLMSMEMDLEKIAYNDARYKEYILGSAEVVGLMCLKVFVKGDDKMYEHLKPSAMKLGSAFQKINFLRDLKDDVKELGRVYFPHIHDIENMTLIEKYNIELEIEEEFNEAYKGIIQLPKEARFGVYLSYKYYTKLLAEIKSKTIRDLMQERIRVSDTKKMVLLFQSHLKNSFNLL